MRDSLPALGFLLALAIVPTFITAGIAWSILHFTDTGILVGSGTVTTLESGKTATLISNQEAENGGEQTVVQCPYFTSAGFIEKVVEHKEYGYRGQRDCPWRVDVSS